MRVTFARAIGSDFDQLGPQSGSLIMPLFSVIIPTYNRATLLARTLASVRAQTCTDYEVIVVDDGSTDDTLAVLRGFPGVQVVTQNNRGPGAARNLGVHQGTGQYLAFLDSDDLWFPWSLETYAAMLRAPSAPSFLAGKPFRFRDETQLPTAPDGSVASNSFPDYLASGDEWRWWGVSSFVIRADAFRAAGGFSEANINGEDADLALKLGEAAGFAQISNPVTFGYRDHDANVTIDLNKSLAGGWHQVRTEQAGGYPGGARRARERRRILTRSLRPLALDGLQRGARSEAWAIYRATFGWHLALARWKFLVGFPCQLFFGNRNPTSNALLV